LKPGTPAHRELLCRSFIDTHLAYEPETLPWPHLDGALMQMLRRFPYWSFARSIERRAGRMVTAFARTLDDPLIREAVALQGFEETRHGRLMTHFLERYGLEAPELAIPDAAAVRDDFLVFGFGECNDSFIGFGAFAFARERQIFPQPLLDIFENVLWEEARHITFFVNWWRYEAALAGRDGLVRRTLEAIGYHARAVMGTAEGAAGVPPLPNRETIDGSVLEGITPQRFLEAALAENRRMMSRLDRRLIKPSLVPRLAGALLLGLRMLPPRPEAGPAEIARGQLAA
jgi:hypothetical protein